MAPGACLRGPRTARPHLAAALAAALLAAPLAAPAAGPADELKELRGRIDRLQKELGETQASRIRAVDALRESEQAISEANRRLFELAREQARARESLEQLNAEKDRLTTGVEEQQRDLSEALYRQYLQGRPAPLAVLLERQDPNQLSRRMHYLTYIYRSRAEQIERLREDIARLEALSQETESRNQALEELKAEQQAQRRRLQQEKAERREVLAKMSQSIQLQRREIGNLRRDQEQLRKLVERLEREAAERRAAQKKKDTREDAVGDNTAFGRLKGRLRMPVRGELAHRFGSPRQETGLTWNGLFIAARTGSEVSAIAPGRVVFADWLRGFGNLLILDHGEGYMSLYGNNETLLRRVGDEVDGGATVAAVGASGGNPETGLYFEIRFRGRPVDPLSWVKR
ncbi:MAG TPA: peptidoglycan DD-metalloendopeptidase family protein [Burkholderiales bacterium]|jgi:septal ring factor EnvC (AmiA/AmiB activator)